MQSDQSLMGALRVQHLFDRWKTKTLIRQCRWADIFDLNLCNFKRAINEISARQVLLYSGILLKFVSNPETVYTAYKQMGIIPKMCFT